MLWKYRGSGLDMLWKYRGYKCLQNVGYLLTLDILLDTYQLKNDFS